MFYPEFVAYVDRSRIEAYLRADNFAQADTELQTLLAWRTRDPRARYLQAVLRRRAGDVDGFEKALATSKALGTAASLVGFQERLLAVQQGAIDKDSEADLLAAAADFSSDDIAAQTYEAIARGYLESYRLKEAWQCLEYWTQWQPNASSARLMMGEILIRTGMPAQAAEQYRRILSDAPELATAKEKLATTLLKVNEVNEAAELLRQISRENPQVAQLWIELSDAERRLGNLDAAREAVHNARKQGVNSHQRGECFSILGQLSMADQDPASAVELLLAATELIPEDATAQHALGSALTLVGQRQAGDLHRDRAQRIREQYDQIQKWTREVIERPDDLDLRVKIGRALIAQGLRNEGVQWLQTALARDANYAPARDALNSLLGTDRTP
ncbi:MAG: tetratricopeptide repeat protein [Aureliella sp.]